MVDYPILWTCGYDLKHTQPVGGGGVRVDPSDQYTGTVPAPAPAGAQTPAPTGTQSLAPALGDVPGDFSARTDDDYELDDFGCEGRRGGGVW